MDCSEGRWIGVTHVSDWCDLEDGESNFLAAGTIIYSIVGTPPTERLAVFDEGVGNGRGTVLRASRGGCKGDVSVPAKLGPPSTCQ